MEDKDCVEKLLHFLMVADIMSSIQVPSDKAG
jgi:hypothetical protein